MMNSYEKEIKRLEKKNKGVIHTYILAIALIGSFLYQFFILGDGVDRFITHTSDIFNGTFYTLVTALFFHSGIIHLGSNLIGLIIFGRVVEKHVGWRIYLLFLLGGIFANFVSNTIAYFLNQSYGSLGASSGIASIIIFAILLDPIRITTILGWFIIGLDVVGITNPDSTTNHLAHLSGYLSLLLLYFFIEKTHKKKVINGLIVNIIMVFLVYIILKINAFI